MWRSIAIAEALVIASLLLVYEEAAQMEEETAVPEVSIVTPEDVVLEVRPIKNSKQTTVSDENCGLDDFASLGITDE
ncbi:MAG: hypothetical protein IJV70_07205 [Clostridia bacterium]|nr:hypothetical protein [Clostridia bacterium]